MPLNDSEKRFLKYWEEQRDGGKKTFVAIYSVGLTVLIFLCAVALGLFMNLPFIKFYILKIIAVASIISAVALSFLIWYLQEKKYHKLTQKIQEEAN